MSNIFIFFILFNCVIVSALLWLLTFLGSYFLSIKNNNIKNKTFECGFFTFNKLDITLNINFFISAIFLLLYDLEFLILIPTFFNIYIISKFIKIMLILLIFVIIISILIDTESNTINWYFN